MFDIEDYLRLRVMFFKYQKYNINNYLSFNQYFIKLLKGGYINKKVFNQNEIMKILHINKIEYNYCIGNMHEETKDSQEQIQKRLKKL